jgi:hypothetical protein
MQEGKETELKRGIDSAIRTTDQEPVLSTGELNAGVKVVPQEHPLPQEAGETGIAFAKESAQVSLNPQLRVPMTRAEAEEASKGPVGLARTWFGALIEYLFKKQEERTA